MSVSCDPDSKDANHIGQSHLLRKTVQILVRLLVATEKQSYKGISMKPIQLHLKNHCYESESLEKTIKSQITPFSSKWWIDED